METIRVNGKLSRRDSVKVVISTDASDEICTLLDRSYENLDALMDDARRKLPKDYDRRMFAVSVMCESRGWSREYRVPKSKPAKRKR